MHGSLQRRDNGGDSLAYNFLMFRLREGSSFVWNLLSLFLFLIVSFFPEKALYLYNDVQVTGIYLFTNTLTF